MGKLLSPKMMPFLLGLLVGLVALWLYRRRQRHSLAYWKKRLSQAQENYHELDQRHEQITQEYQKIQQQLRELAQENQHLHQQLITLQQENAVLIQQQTESTQNQGRHRHPVHRRPNPQYFCPRLRHPCPYFREEGGITAYQNHRHFFAS